jgi:hypothetical protein
MDTTKATLLAELLDEYRQVPLESRLAAINADTALTAALDTLGDGSTSVEFSSGQIPLCGATAKLDLALGYLRRVHFVSYYGGKRFRDEAHMLSLSASVIYRSLPYVPPPSLRAAASQYFSRASVGIAPQLLIPVVATSVPVGDIDFGGASSVVDTSAEGLKMQPDADSGEREKAEGAHDFDGLATSSRKRKLQDAESQEEGDTAGLDGSEAVSAEVSEFSNNQVAAEEDVEPSHDANSNDGGQFEVHDADTAAGQFDDDAAGTRAAPVSDGSNDVITTGSSNDEGVGAIISSAATIFSSVSSKLCYPSLLPLLPRDLARQYSGMLNTRKVPLFDRWENSSMPPNP